jgi:tyrosyl-tRNA synthetase
MEDRSTGISFTEFSYMLLQGFDFYTLRHTLGCELQIGATDQWGNITVGTELTRKKLGATVWGIVFPLLTKADGTKYGKTATGTVWLDRRKTSPYRFYQFFMNTSDADVTGLLKTLTFLPAGAIADLDTATRQRPEARDAQRQLAREMTTLVHGREATDAAENASAILFGGPVADVSEATFAEIVGEVPTTDVHRVDFDRAGASLVELAVRAGLSSSKGQARKDLEAGGLYLNNARVTDLSRAVTTADVLFGKYVLLRKGKRSYAVLRLTSHPL